MSASANENAAGDATSTEPPSSRPVTLERLVEALRRALVPMMAAGGAGLLAGFSLSYLVTPLYRAVVVVTPATAPDSSGSLARMAGQFGGLASLAGVGLPAGSNRDEALAVLRSRAFGEVIIREQDLLHRFFGARWDPSTSAWKRNWWRKDPTIDDAWLILDQRVRSIVEDRDRSLVSLRIESADRTLVAPLANAMITRVNKIMRDRKLEELKKSLGYLEAELAAAQLVGIQQAISRVIENQLTDRMIASVREDYSFRVIDPAVEPPVDKFVSPSRPLFAAFGLLFGLVTGFGFASYRAHQGV